jgi:hypothetical protein
MPDSEPKRPWTQIAIEMQHETDASRLLELAQELNRALAESRRLLDDVEHASANPSHDAPAA